MTQFAGPLSGTKGFVDSLMNCPPLRGAGSSYVTALIQRHSGVRTSHKTEAAMNLYLAILLPEGIDGWSAHIPDFPSCSAASRTADLARMHVAKEAAILVDEMR